MDQRELWQKLPPTLPAEVRQHLTRAEQRLFRASMAGHDCARLLAWVRRTPLIAGAFMKETRAILDETPDAFVQVEEVLCRVRRLHGVRICNHKGWFARWLSGLLPEMRRRTRRRNSRFDPFASKLEGGGRG